MPNTDICGALYDDYDGMCEREPGHEPPHREGVLEWSDDD